MHWKLFILPSAVLLLLGASVLSGPPKQPASGPGGASYRHAAVQKSVYGENENQYWLFEPSDPVPRSAPLIIFLHGWGAVNPQAYGAWIEHLVRRGNIVVYPRYQTGRRYPPGKIAPNAAQAVKNAIACLRNGRHVQPETDKTAVVGHSAGGQTAANLAVLAKSSGLPEPKAVMCVEPGKSWNKRELSRIPLLDLSLIPKDVLLLTVAGDKDNIASDVDARRIIRESVHVPRRNKNFVLVVSDAHGRPSLTADHFAPCAVSESYDSAEKQDRKKPGIFSSTAENELLEPVIETRSNATVNALDYYGFWKLFDGLCDAAFYEKDREYALGNTPEQRRMGKWSDGTPVKEMIVSDNP